MIQFLAQAIKDRIDSIIITQTLGNAKAAHCRITDDGRPTVPYQGNIFFAVHQLDRIPSTPLGGYYLKESYNFTITITSKVAGIVRSRIGNEKLSSNHNEKEIPIHYLADLVIGCFHLDFGLANAANTLIENSLTPDIGRFTAGKGPEISGDIVVEPKTGEWLGGKIDDRGSISALACSLTFSNLESVRSIDQLKSLLVLD
jgi:hypothetical protein